MPKHWITDIEPFEVSLVDKPATRRSFVALKNEGGASMTEEQLEQLEAAGVAIDPEALDLEALDDLVEKSEEDSDAAGMLTQIKNLLVGAKRDTPEQPADSEDAEPTEAEKRATEAEKRAAEAEKRVERLERNSRVDKAQTRLESLKSERYIGAGVAETIEPVVTLLAEDDVTFKSEGGDESALDALFAALKANGEVHESFFSEEAIEGTEDDGDAWGGYKRADEGGDE